MDVGWVVISHSKASVSLSAVSRLPAADIKDETTSVAQDREQMLVDRHTRGLSQGSQEPLCAYTPL